MSLRIPPNLTPIAGEGNEPESMPINSIWYRYLQALQASIPTGTGIPEAPQNGITYGRNNATWVQVVSGGAPLNSTYVVMTADPTLPNERVLTAGAGISITDDGAGNAVTISSTATTSAPGLPARSVQYNSDPAGTFTGNASFLVDAANRILNIGSADVNPAGWTIRPIVTNAVGVRGADLTISAGESTNPGGTFPGRLFLRTMNGGAPSNTGMIDIKTGDRNAPNSTGELFIGTGDNASSGSGRIVIQTGAAPAGGRIEILTRGNGGSGTIDIFTSAGDFGGAPISIYTATATGNNSGAVNLTTGEASGAFGSGGPLNLTAGASTSFGGSGSGGSINLVAGNANASGPGGNITLQAGTSSSGTNGTIQFLSPITLSGSNRMTLGASVAGGATLRVPHGAAPTTPVNGDIWTTTAGLFVRINGATVGPLT